VYSKSSPGKPEGFRSVGTGFTDRFPYKEEEEDKSAILNRIMNLKQGNKKLDDYIDEGIRLKCEISSEFQPLLAEQWVSGLQKQATVTAIRITMHQWKKEGNLRCRRKRE
jgi:hypothetical protein